MTPKRNESQQDGFAQFRRALVEAAQLVFSDYRRQFAGERFYAFALYADNSADGMCPASQTEEAYQATLAKSKSYQERHANNKLSEGEMGLMRYCPDEWNMKYCGTQRRTEWSQATNVLDVLLQDETLPRRQSVDRAFETMIQVLADLDSEGLFGRGEEREAITLMIWITDSSLAEDWWAKSVKQLNPAKVYERFISEIPVDYRGS